MAFMRSAVRPRSSPPVFAPTELRLAMPEKAEGGDGQDSFLKSNYVSKIERIIYWGCSSVGRAHGSQS